MKAIHILILLALFTVPTLAQVKSLPPLGVEIYKTPGKILVAYDELTDKTGVKVFIPLSDDVSSGLHLIAVSMYEGRRPKEPLKAILILVGYADATSKHQDDQVLFLVDDERIEVTSVYTFTQAKDPGKISEAFVIPSEMSAKEVNMLGSAKRFKGRVGSRTEFELNETARRTLRDFAAQMNKQ